MGRKGVADPFVGLWTHEAARVEHEGHPGLTVGRLDDDHVSSRVGKAHLGRRIGDDSVLTEHDRAAHDEGLSYADAVPEEGGEQEQQDDRCLLHAAIGPRHPRLQVSGPPASPGAGRPQLSQSGGGPALLIRPRRLPPTSAGSPRGEPSRSR